MTDLVVSQGNIPAKIEDLAKFVLIGRDKLQAVRAEISAINKLGLAKEVYEQKKTEAQAIAETVTLAEMRTGELLKAIPKASGGDRKSDNFKKPIGGQFEKITQDTVPTSKPKAEVIKELGFNRHQAQRMEQMAENPEIVKKAIQEARDNDDIISRAFVLQKIKQAKIPIQQNTGNNERYTPSEYIEAAREVMGSIDLDPASSDLANETVKATTYYTQEQNGLEYEWFGNIWLNPPYAKDLIGQFADKLAASAFNQAIILVHNATETKWFSRFISKASAIVFPTGRIDCKTPGDNPNTPLQGSAFIYCGDNPQKFLDVFLPFGWGAKLNDSKP